MPRFLLCILSCVSLILSSCREENVVHNVTLGGIKSAAAYPESMWDTLTDLDAIKVEHFPESIPSDLHWEDGSGLPEIGDPEAKKGGSVHLVNAGPYPAHLRPIGGLGTVFFHYTLYANVDIKLVELHPLNPEKHIIPGVAQSWAMGKDGRTVYFRLNPQARYSNGRPVRAGDFFLGLYLRSSDYIKDPLALSKIASSIEKASYFDEHTFSVTLRQPELLAPYTIAQLLSPAEPSFYSEFGPDYVERYAQRIAPTTGAYSVLPSDFKTNREIIMSKVPQWWAADLPYYRYRYNVDKRHIHFLADEAQLWEFFWKGKIDILQTRNLSAWQQRLQHEHVREGRIEKHRFLSHYPLPPYGIYLNARTLPDINLRQGLLHAMDMNRALDLLFRGEYERLAFFSEGYGNLSPKQGEVSQVKFDVNKSREYFHKAGYTTAGSDGILRKEDGTRLSITLSYTPSEKVSSLVQQLAQSARLCGAEIIADPTPWQQTAKKVEHKTYQMAFWADVASFPLPSLETQFHSRFYDTVGRNLHALDDANMDEHIDAMHDAKTTDELAKATLKVNQRLAALAVWLPGWKENRCYVASWRHIRFPDTTYCQFSTPRPYDVQEAHLFWVDEEAYPKDGTHAEVDRFINPSYPAMSE